MIKKSLKKQEKVLKVYSLNKNGSKVKKKVNIPTVFFEV